MCLGITRDLVKRQVLTPWAWAGTQILHFLTDAAFAVGTKGSGRLLVAATDHGVLQQQLSELLPAKRKEEKRKSRR